MPEPSQPSELAREALRRLATRRLQPTPDNFRTLYHEIAGTAAPEPFPERSLKALAAALPRDSTEQVRVARQIESAITNQDWAAVRTVIVGLARGRTEDGRAWGSTLRDLLAQLDRRQAGVTPVRKREAIEHVLGSAGSDSDQLRQRLQSLARSWAQSVSMNADPATTAEDATPAPSDRGAASELREIAARVLESGVGVLLGESSEAAGEAARLAAEVRVATDAVSIQSFSAKLKRFAFRIQWVAEDQAELRGALLHLLQLIVENIGELVMEDQWLRGQIDVLHEAVAEPLSLRRLDEAERRLKDVIYKQGVLKKSLEDSKERLRRMLASFVDHLSAISETTGGYHDRMGRFAARIGAARDMTELSEVVGEVLRETRDVQAAALRSRDQLRDMQSRVAEAEREVSRLQNELAQTSELVRQDALTGALNRKGFDEALARESARARRRDAPLCVALIDLDDFKKLNDTHGHQAGDEALIRLAEVMRQTLRPQDTVARYGGEEFVLLLPETEIEAAVQVLVRLQRELTRQIFLRDNNKVLITFSAGVTPLDAGESGQEALARADAAMYEAKRNGKNRVVAKLAGDESSDRPE